MEKFYKFYKININNLVIILENFNKYLIYLQLVF